MPAASFPFVPDDDWLYERNDDNTARFVLGIRGDDPLLCVGINPSTAAPNVLDRTVARVAKAAAAPGHDSFVMLNVYPQRSTDPRGLHAAMHPALRRANEERVAELVRGRPLTVWAAWGTNITRRPHLAHCLGGLLAQPALSNCSWASRGPLIKDLHPRHPLYVRDDAPFEPFDVRGYARRLGASV